MATNRRNLKDPLVGDLPKRLSTLETQSPLGFSSIEEGGLRVASHEGLTVEGSILGVANNALGLPAHIDWRGTADFTGDVSAQKFSAGVGAFRTTFDNRGFTSVGTGSRGAIGGPEETFSYEGGLDGGGFRFTTTGEYESDAWFGAGSVRVSDLPSSSSPTSMNVLLVNSDGEFYRGPTYSSGGSGGGPGVGEGDLIWPFSLDLVTSDYGWRTHPVTGEPETFHEGVDFGMWPVTFGTPVPCSGDGVVTRTDVWGGWGMSVSVDHGGGIGTQYNHLEGYAVNVGDTVYQGDIIGYVGSTGTSTGAHLDFNVLVDGHVNPVGSPRANPHDYVGLG